MFYEFLRDKLLYPLASTSIIFQCLFLAIGEVFDNVYLDAVTLVKEWFPSYSTNLSRHMLDRSITPFANESDEEIRTRVTHAYQFYQDTMLMSGIGNILAYYIDAVINFEFVNNYPFSYFIIVDDELTVDYKITLEKMLDEYKKAHVKVYFLNNHENLNRFLIGDCFIGEIKI